MGMTRFQRSGQRGGYAVAAQHSAKELSEMRREGDRKRWENLALSKCANEQERRALRADPLELERKAQIYKHLYFVDLAQRREDKKRERLVAKNTREWVCPECARAEGRVVDRSAGKSVCLRHWAQKIMEDKKWPPLRTLWMICTIGQGEIEEQRETIRALHQQLAEAS